MRLFHSNMAHNLFFDKQIQLYCKVIAIHASCGEKPYLRMKTFTQTKLNRRVLLTLYYFLYYEA